MAKNQYLRVAFVTMLVASIALTVGLAPGLSQAASHREAPLISMDPTADITDFFFFRSYEPGQDDKVVLIMDVIPGEEPSAGPNYYNFDPNVLYKFNIDNDADGVADDVQFEFQFTTEIRGLIADQGFFLSYVAIPPITSLDGEGSEGLGLRQTYTITMVKDGERSTLESDLIAVPSNVGPRTMPDYESLVEQGIYDVHFGDDAGRVFAGQRDDPFYIDLGATFDTLNLRREPLPLLDPDEDVDDETNPFGVDMLGGFNVHTIALEVPISFLTEDGEGADSTHSPVLGGYVSTSRRSVQVLDGDQENASSGSDEDWVQIQRLANPLVNELIIGTVDKDRWNRTEPENEGDFVDYYMNPRFAAALETVFEVPAAKDNRQDLVDLLLKYDPNDHQLSELLRVDVSVNPTLLTDQKRMGPLAMDTSGNPDPDPAGWPNGRRPIDDVTDEGIRVIGGQNYINGRAGDGVNTNDVPLPDEFPFVPTPFDGVNRVHPNP